MNFKALALTALAATTVGFGVAPKAEASYNSCYYPSAATQMETMLAGGFTLGEAWQDQVAGGTVTDTLSCWKKTHGYARQYSYTLPRLLRAADAHARSN